MSDLGRRAEENSLRVFVYTILKNKYFDGWANIQINVGDDKKETISAIAKKRIRQAKDFGYLGYDIVSPLMHLNSGELIRLITSDEYWKHFSIYFKGSKDIIRNKLDEIGSIRNALAHFRPIKEDDVELIKLNAKYALIAVEACLSDMISTSTIIPSNTEDEWYKRIITCGSPSCSIALYQSKSEDWIRIQNSFSCKIIDKIRYGEKTLSYQVLNLRTPFIIDLFKGIQKYVTFIFEDIAYTTMPTDLNPRFVKKVSFVFLKSVLSEQINEIYDSIIKMLKQITEEEELSQLATT